jgi:hypothetical protein
MSARSAACRPSACRKAASTGALKGAPSAHSETREAPLRDACAVADAGLADRVALALDAGGAARKSSVALTVDPVC